MTRDFGRRMNCRRRGWDGVGMGSFLLSIVMFVPSIGLAQSDEQFDKAFTFMGNWETRIRNPDGEERGNCGGRIGRWTIGALAIRQDGFQGVDASNVFVGRLSANVLEESSLGMIATKGDPNSNRDNSLVGFDFRYLNTRLRGGRVLEADAWFQTSDTAGLDGEDSAFGFGLRMPNNSEWRGGISVKQVAANFNPALGFVSRSDIRDTSVDIGYRHFTGGGLLQSMYTGIDAQRISFLDGGLQSQVILGRAFEIESNSGERFNYHYSWTREVVTRGFTIYNDETRAVVVPSGSYTFGESVVSVETGGAADGVGGIDLPQGRFSRRDPEQHHRRFYLEPVEELHSCTQL